MPLTNYYFVITLCNENHTKIVLLVATEILASIKNTIESQKTFIFNLMEAQREQKTPFKFLNTSPQLYYNSIIITFF